MNSSLRRDFSVAEKLDFLKKYDQLPKMSQAAAAAQLGISQPFLCKLLKIRYEIESSCDNNESMTRKRKRSGKEEHVEKALKKWYMETQDRDAPVNGKLLKQKAEELAQRMGKENFHATNGWFSRWLKRENVTYKKKPRGKSGEADLTAANARIQDVWPSVIANYSPDDVFNADETALYYRALPEHTYIIKNSTVEDVEACTERVTVLCCTSMSGKKSELLVIGKRKNPRSFRGVKKLPVRYCANANAWMTSAIFSDWLQTWDKVLRRKIVLLIDDCTAHSVHVQLKNIKLLYQPANPTSILQPCDQGITRTLKTFYRHEMRARILRSIDNMSEMEDTEFKVNDLAKRISLLDALHLLAAAWCAVTETTIRNCFQKGDPSLETNLEEGLQSVPDTIPEDIESSIYEEWMAIDENVATASLWNDDDIISDVVCPTEEEESEDELDEELPEPPTHQQMTQALEILSQGIQHYGENFEAHYSYVRYVNGIMQGNQGHYKM